MKINSLNTEINEVIEIGKKLLNEMGVKVKEISARGIHIYFVADESHVICKIKEKKLFDFVEFTNKEEAIETFKKQRVPIEHKPRIIERRREGDICLRSFFVIKAF